MVKKHGWSVRGIAYNGKILNMKLGHNYYVYIVECHDGPYYTGITYDLERRIAGDSKGKNQQCFSFNSRPVTVRYYEHFYNRKDATEREKQLKGWSRKKKETLFKGDFEEIKRLAKSKNNSSSNSESQVQETSLLLSNS